MIDILTLDASDRATVDELVTVLTDHLDLDQRRHLLEDLDRWNRSLSKADRDCLESYRRMQQRGAFVPCIVRAYLETASRLAKTDQWREVMMWRELVLSIDPTKREAA